MRRAAAIVLVVSSGPITAQLTGHVPAAFTSDECDAIVKLFSSMEHEEDQRQNPLLPLMEAEPFGVRRINRFDDGKHDEAMRHLHERLLDITSSMLQDHVPDGALTSVGAFRDVVDFTLLHEFEHTSFDRFDWHTDTKPGDAAGRTLNLNVMLSREGVDYTGGDLHVGNATLNPRLGDVYAYPAALPHKVGALLGGRRFTLVIALTERKLLEARGAAAAAAAEANGGAAHELMANGEATRELEARQRAYWSTADATFASLLKGDLKGEPKVHILFGEHLEAAGRTAEAQAAYCQAYRASSAEGIDFAATFYASGVKALQRQPPELSLAENYLAMAACVDEGHPEAADALAVVREALEIVRAQPAKDEL